MQVMMWSGVAACAALAVMCGLADRRRTRRADLDRVGVTPWPALQFALLFAGILLAALALSG